jgi:hypothetical protein
VIVMRVARVVDAPRCVIVMRVARVVDAPRCVIVMRVARVVDAPRCVIVMRAARVVDAPWCVIVVRAARVPVGCANVDSGVRACCACAFVCCSVSFFYGVSHVRQDHHF